MIRTAAVLVLLAAPAYAAPPPVGSEDWEIMAPFARWIEQQSNNIGSLCCSIADARPAEVRQRDGKWEVRFNRPEQLPTPHPYGWQVVPDEAILRDRDGQPVSSPAGISLAWWYGGQVRCFTIPSGI